MRLSCPNCDAEYEVEDGLIPEDGRDVQCSNCTTTWFQRPDAATARPIDGEDDGDAEPTPAPAATNIPRPKTDPDALKVIHEEVARENKARQAEASGIEVQTDMGLENQPAAETPPTPKKEEPPAETTAPKPPIPPVPPVVPAPVTMAETTDEDSDEKRQRLPDIEEINSTLRDAPKPSPEEGQGKELSRVDKIVRRQRGFRIGFGLTLIAAVLVLALYVYAPQLSQNFPDQSEHLTGYVTWVDQTRVDLETAAGRLIDQINDMVASYTR
ncbi:zinc-ribbon domain-containing protein [Litoreibacter roseus]|uniref:Zinc finger/thioredoxin putative domain-containing protein n=1 Tax=Litoreibacter roseus TaxID=2601869 RepID=A0A6N6JKK8_9RHOB|nr:zinc-ribbon domain-containing protein [Litoreibacter roseus]GFE66380.1 hypothetical protein KIN_34540 [Litoreibacter roseus]